MRMAKPCFKNPSGVTQQSPGSPWSGAPWVPINVRRLNPEWGSTIVPGIRSRPCETPLGFNISQSSQPGVRRVAATPGFVVKPVPGSIASCFHATALVSCVPYKKSFTALPFPCTHSSLEPVSIRRTEAGIHHWRIQTHPLESRHCSSRDEID